MLLREFDNPLGLTRDIGAGELRTWYGLTDLRGKRLPFRDVVGKAVSSGPKMFCIEIWLIANLQRNQLRAERRGDKLRFLRSLLWRAVAEIQPIDAVPPGRVQI